MAAIMSIMILTLLISLTYETEANQYDRKMIAEDASFHLTYQTLLSDAYTN